MCLFGLLATVALWYCWYCEFAFGLAVGFVLGVWFIYGFGSYYFS